MSKLAVLFFGAVSIAFGQEGGKITFFESMDACLAAASDAVNNYQPVFTDHLSRWQKMVQQGSAQLVTDGKTYCVQEWTLEGKIPGKHIIRWPANNSYFKGNDGKIADGRCGNTVYEIREVPPPQPPPAPPAEVTCNCPPPAQLPPRPELVPINPLPDRLEFETPGELEVFIHVNRGHKFPIPCIPREKNAYGIGWSMVGCAALGFGAYEIYEAAAGGVALVKIATPVISAAP